MKYRFLSVLSVALLLCFLADNASARSAAYHAPSSSLSSSSSSSLDSGVIMAESDGTGTAGESSGMWEKTKDVTSDVWDGTKKVGSDVWDGTKKVSSDIWDGTKKVGGDVSNAVSGSDEATAPSAVSSDQ